MMTVLCLIWALGLGDIVPVTQGGRAVICILLVVGFLPSLYLVSAVETMTTFGIRFVGGKLSMSVSTVHMRFVVFCLFPFVIRH